MPIARRRAGKSSDQAKEEKVAKPRKGRQTPATTATDREGLLVALNKLKPALRSGGAIPELAHLWFGSGYVRAYDGGLGVRLAQDLGVACGVPGRPLLGVLATSALKEVDVSHDEKAVALVVKLGRSRTKLNILDAGRDPWPFPDGHGGGARLSEEAIEATRSVLIAKPAQATRLEHHGICFYTDGDAIDVYATDSKTIVQATYEDAKANLPEFVFMPRPLAEQIVALCPHGAELTCADDYFAAVGAGVEVCSNVLDATGIIDLPALVDGQVEPHPEAVPLPTGLEAAIDRAEVLAGSGDDAVVSLKISGKKFGMSGKFSYGELNEDLAMEEEHPDVELKVEAAILRRGLLASDVFSATESSLAFWGGENFMYLVSSRT